MPRLSDQDAVLAHRPAVAVPALLDQHLRGDALAMAAAKINTDGVPLVINPRTGEQEPCQGCVERETVIVRNERRHHAKIRDLERRLRAALGDDEDLSGLSDRERELVRLAEEVFAYWRWRCGKRDTTEFTLERREAVLARLRAGRTFDEVLCAVDGAAAEPFVRGARRYDDLELICRNGSKFDSFVDRGEVFRRREEERDRERSVVLAERVALQTSVVSAERRCELWALGGGGLPVVGGWRVPVDDDEGEGGVVIRLPVGRVRGGRAA